jgi:cytochrome P450
MHSEDQLRPYPFAEFRGELPDELLRMVTEEPVGRVRLPDGRPAWLVTGYREVCAVLADPRFTRHGPTAAAAATSAPGGGPDAETAVCPVRDLSMDGAAHATLRRLAARAFTARRIEAYRPRVQELTDELLDRMEQAGPPGDLVAGLVAPLPALVICEVLGVPRQDRERFNEWAVDLLSISAYGSAEATRSDAALRDYLAERLAEKRRRPGADLLSVWAAGTGAEHLPDEEIIGLAFGVLLGGREINSISAGLHVLFRHPDQLARLRARPELLPQAVEEILRHTSVSPMGVVQTAVADVELAGVRIRTGDTVMTVPWAANRHPGVFPNPNDFDLDRPRNPHLTFGYGPHFCLGAALGRLELEIAIGTLLRRFPRLAPAVPLAELRWRNERVNCGIAEFPVTW